MILILNTSTTQYSIGLMDMQGVLVSEYILPYKNLGSKIIMPSIEFLIKHVENMHISNIKGIAVAIGPGSFTGLKVGLSIAKGMSFSLSIPVVGVSSLEALAMQVLEAKDIPITAIIDSRKKEYFVAQFKWNEHKKLVRISSDIYLKLKEFPDFFCKETIFIGNDYNNQSKLLKEVMGSNLLIAPPYLWHIRASNIGMLAINRFLKEDFDDPLFLEPIYLRPPEIRSNPYRLEIANS